MTFSNRKRVSSDSRSPKRKNKKSKKEHRKKDKRDSSPEDFQHGFRETNERYDSTGRILGSNSSKKDICGYTNDTNPFMDPNLTDQFVWKKKTGHIPLSCREKEMELESVQKRMKENERLRQERMDEQEIIQRAKELQNSGSRKPDSTFDLDQAKIRSKIRIAGNRGKPIDLLIQYVIEEENSDEETEAIIHEPTEYLIGLSEADLGDLLVDIHDYSKNMEPGKNTQYWDDMKTVAEDELSKISKNHLDCRNEGVTKESVEDMKEMLLDGTIEDAIELQSDAQKMLSTGDPRHIDVAYYEFFCRLATVVIAKRRLQGRHKRNLRMKLEQLKTEQGIVSSEQSKPPVAVVVKETEPARQKPNPQSIKSIPERDSYDVDKYEPTLFLEEDRAEELLGEIIYSAADDAKKLEFMRNRFVEMSTIARNNEEALLRRARNDDEKGDEAFGELISDELQDQAILWSDKYRPRKPRFLNRVNTGFDWNKYNQTHYDIDNPPPKIVQGYKFNILYPDLIDKSKTPTFELAVCKDNDQQAVITFRAGPPYQDIAFKLVNKEWETSERYGYKCQFYRDMLQLHFHFKRYRYRK